MVKCADDDQLDDYRSLPPILLPAKGIDLIRATAQVLRSSREVPLLFTMYRVPISPDATACFADEMAARRGSPVDPGEKLDTGLEGARFVVIFPRGEYFFTFESTIMPVHNSLSRQPSVANSTLFSFWESLFVTKMQTPPKNHAKDE